MYLTYEEYTAMGGTADADTFDRLEPEAELLLDVWTLNRLHVPEAIPDGIPSSVKVAMRRLVDYVPSIEEGYKRKANGEEVSSFSNGVNSFSFATSDASAGSGNTALDAAYDQITGMLPIELVSTCVSYNYAN